MFYRFDIMILFQSSFRLSLSPSSSRRQRSMSCIVCMCVMLHEIVKGFVRVGKGGN